MNDTEAVRDVLKRAGIEIGEHDSLKPFVREVNGIFDALPEKPGMFILEISAYNTAYGNCESTLNKSGLTIHSYGSFMLGNRIAVISLDIPPEQAGVFSMEVWLKAINSIPNHAIAVRMKLDLVSVQCELYRTVDENAWACHRALRAILNDDSLTDQDLVQRGLDFYTYNSR